MYSLGYTLICQAVASGNALWFLIVLAAGKIIATSLTIGIGGSGGVFAPSLFIGATSGMAFGEIANHLLGPGPGGSPPGSGKAAAHPKSEASATRATAFCGREASVSMPTIVTEASLRPPRRHHRHRPPYASAGWPRPTARTS
jgi:H+/Cl- antiporter ClcA